MAIMYGTQNVDVRYSSILEPNLYSQSVFIPGVTYTNKYELNAAGQIVVRKIGSVVVEVGTPARNFNHEQVADELLQISLNNNFQRSRKIFGVVAAAVGFNKAEASLAEAIQEVKEGMLASSLACLSNEGTVSSDVTVITETNVKELIIERRTELVNNKANPNVVLASPLTYESILKFAGKEFIPANNERIITTGQAGTWLGMLVLECNGFNNASAKYYDYTGTLRTIDLTKIDFIMYDFEAFSRLENLSALRLIDSENFVGSLAQVEMNIGLRVTNAKRVVAKKHV